MMSGASALLRKSNAGRISTELKDKDLDLATSKQRFFILTAALIALIGFLAFGYLRSNTANNLPVIKDNMQQPVETDVAVDKQVATDGAALTNNVAIAAQSGQIHSQWQLLKQEADKGSASAACQLYKVLEDCRLNVGITSEADRTLSALAAGETWPNAENQAIELHAISENLDNACKTIPTEMHSDYTKYLLQAALSGHEPSMYQYVTDPGIDTQRAVENVDAIRNYRDNASRLVDQLLQNGSVEGLSLAFHVANGATFVDLSPIKPRNPAEVIRLGTALQLAGKYRPATEASIQKAIAEVTPQVASNAKRNGEALAKNFNRKFSSEPNGDPTPTSTHHECDELSK
jgi:hypothetical protein